MYGAYKWLSSWMDWVLILNPVLVVLTVVYLSLTKVVSHNPDENSENPAKYIRTAIWAGCIIEGLFGFLSLVKIYFYQ